MLEAILIMRTILRNATRIDCVDPTPKDKAAAVLDDDRTAQVLAD